MIGIYRSKPHGKTNKQTQNHAREIIIGVKEERVREREGERNRRNEKIYTERDR